MWSYKQAKPDNPDLGLGAAEMKRPGATYTGSAATKTASVCRDSPWAPGWTLPRITQDGGACGAMAYFSIGISSCHGTPSAMVGIPGHAGHYNVKRRPSGKWELERKSLFETSGASGIQTSGPALRNLAVPATPRGTCPTHDSSSYDIGRLGSNPTS